MGNELTLNITQTEPVVVYNANNETLYTLIMVDPDVPKRQNATYRSHLHWWIINIQGSAVTDGCFVTDYAGPTPAVGTDLHRYVFLVFKQDKRIYHNEDSRSRFSVPDVINELGDPVYGNFFQAQAA